MTSGRLVEQTTHSPLEGNHHSFRLIPVLLVIESLFIVAMTLYPRATGCRTRYCYGGRESYRLMLVRLLSS